jgi:hypothetical protein
VCIMKVLERDTQFCDTKHMQEWKVKHIVVLYEITDSIYDQSTRNEVERAYAEYPIPWNEIVSCLVNLLDPL